MDPVRSTAARARGSDAIPLPGGGPADPGGAGVKRPVPAGRALSRGGAVVREEVRKTQGQLLVWYPPPQGVAPKPSPADIEAHAMLFAEPWHVALVVTPGHAPLGGFFRIATDGASASQYLPFYELLDAASLLPDGRKVSDLAWVNYRTEESIFTSDRVSNPGLEVQPRLLFPDNVEESIPGAAPSPARHQRVARVARLAGYAALGVVAGAVLFNVYHALASSRGPVKAGPVAAPSPRDRVDRDRKSTRLNSSHLVISYAVFCLKKKKRREPTSATPL